MKSSWTFVILAAGAIAALAGVSAWIALLAGVFLALSFGNPKIQMTRGFIHPLLAYSIIGLGAGMNLEVIARAGASGIGYTFTSIACVLAVGTLLGLWVKTERNSSILISMGTAICGGSAIAAAAPTLRAKPQEVSVALGTVFILNALALVLFPFIGHYFSLTESQFGLWSALAIHDTSSVVGATLQYGPRAMEIGTTVKLTRALWIIPVTLGLGYLESRRSDGLSEKKMKVPWFIFGFVLAAAVFTWVPSLQAVGHSVEWVARRSLVFTLFLIGFSLDRNALKSVGFQPMIQGALLWLITGTVTLVMILGGWIHA